jgi:hypothetical protein
MKLLLALREPRILGFGFIGFVVTVALVGFVGSHFVSHALSWSCKFILYELLSTLLFVYLNRQGSFIK